ncbi:hypothetical protein FHU38_002094 [Saccharomonospora amisosensis]|uniref:ATP-grasp domain-containing protein n=1 Tax=Saccharomonospora amisosensis TaxID=1128677 RepID=A0A7X5UPF6_9PSEU|nr:hypothetical protein [Saccharomonospora amisosensis]NIJ11750.1 hypothetical protein [Saccharomonospora amisosensis]
MTAKVILATSARLPHGDPDERAVPPALADVGVTSRWFAWDDPAADFTAADLVILRSTWDYPDRWEEFLRWCASVPKLRNTFDVVRWNTDKSYLVELAESGQAVVPTRLLRPGDTPSWPDAEFVLKPAVGAGSRGVGRFGPADTERAADHLTALHARGRAVLLQPYQRRVDTEGETALVFFCGVYSHAFTKGPMLAGQGMDRSGLFVTEKRAATDPPPRFRALAEDVLDAAAHRLGKSRAELLYARVDVVRVDDGAPALLELELTEPSLGFEQAGKDAAARFASAVRQHLA